MDQNQYNKIANETLQSLRGDYAQPAPAPRAKQKSTVNLEADLIEAELEAVENAIWDLWAARGYAAIVPMLARYKAAADMPPALVDALSAARAAAGDDATLAALQQLASGGQQPALGTKLADEKAATMKSDNGKPLFRPVRNKSGKLLR